MKLKPIFLLLALMSFLTANQQSLTFFDRVDIFLKQYVKNGSVDYRAIQENPAQLNRLLKEIEQFDLSTLTTPEQEMAFWINTYNILVINGIITHYPLNSPLDVPGFFKSIRYRVAGRQLTLDEIENIHLRERFKDARVHFVLVCAARGCPPLSEHAYRPEGLMKQLEQRAEKILNDPRFVKVDEQTQTVQLSEIFKWFKTDFESDGKSVIDYINRYRKTPIPADFRIQYIQYDWNLNKM